MPTDLQRGPCLDFEGFACCAGAKLWDMSWLIVLALCHHVRRLQLCLALQMS